MNRKLASALGGLAAFALVVPSSAALAAPAPAPAAERGPMAFQGEGAGVCARLYYCFYAADDFNVGGAEKQVWMHNDEWKHFDLDSHTGKPYVPSATNRVFSVVNNTQRTIHFLEWDFASGPSICLTVPPATAVKNVRKYSDGGFGSVAFDDHLPSENNCKKAG